MSRKGPIEEIALGVLAGLDSLVGWVFMIAAVLVAIGSVGLILSDCLLTALLVVLAIVVWVIVKAVTPPSARKIPNHDYEDLMAELQARTESGE